MARKATVDDYVRVQGGEPEITQKGKLFKISHNYEGGDGMNIVTHKSPEDRGTVVLGDVEFDVAKLRRFEGDPCEKRSRDVGGEGYSRKR
jgi:hypothetical protein